jgi:hypothetical protein
MAETAIARLFTHGRSQAVRLPKEFRLPGDRVRVRHLASIRGPSWPGDTRNAVKMQ